MLRWIFIAAICLGVSCQARQQTRVDIVDGEAVKQITVGGPLIPASMLHEAGIELKPGDRVLLDGYPVDPNAPLPYAPAIHLQVQRAVTVWINGTSMSTTASTVGEALVQRGNQLYAADLIDPPANTAITDGLHIKFEPSRQFTISADQTETIVRSSGATVAAVLAGAGMPLVGLDFSQPAEDQPAPQDGKIRVVRVTESIVLTQKAIPFQSQYQSSDQVELDHEQVLQAGQVGLASSRTRIRYEDGQEVSRLTEPETVVRPPVDRVTAYGTKVVMHTATVDGVQIQYWRVVQMFATAYSPCNSAADRCYPGTSSGVPVTQGVVAVKYSWYLAMQGQALYIPGYGRATIEDVCGGCLGKPWVDLGYTDAQYAQYGDQWGKYVTVYFLAPAPASILNPLQ